MALQKNSDKKLLSEPRLCACHFINEEHSRRHSRLIHSHEDFMELFYVYSGSGKYWVDNICYEVQENDIIVCNANILHGEEPQDERHIRSYSVGITNIQYPDLPKNWICERDVNPIIHGDTYKNFIRETFAFIYNYTDAGQTISESAHILTHSLLSLTLELLGSQKKLAPEKKKSSAHASAERILFYINDHYREALTLETIAGALKIKENYLSHLFKAEYGTSPIHYAMKRRIGEAQGLLMDSSRSIGDISDHLGFIDTAHFTRQFKKYVGMPPGQYRGSFLEMEE